MRRTMPKAKALELLGGSAQAAAAEISITHTAVCKWPDVLPPRITDRVTAAIARRVLPAMVLGLEEPKLSRRTKARTR
jgi:hypothetical protein